MSLLFPITYSVRRIIEVIAVFIQPSVSREVQYYINLKKIPIAVVNMTHSERIVFKDGEVLYGPQIAKSSSWNIK